ncbi:MAG: hypothetical protein M3P40_03140 [Actinomycetota bacterium]|nr:hypothetical protein [Actinomycetota bacterium]
MGSTTCGPTLVAVVFFRFGLPALFAVMGVAMLMFGPQGARYEGFFMSFGAAGSILLLTMLWRLGSQGDNERAQEERAREYYARHGRWPDER